MNEAPYQTSRLKFWRGQKLDDSFSSTLHNIESTGWSALLIEGDEVGKRFGYSVGIYDTQDVPEIIVVGLPSRVAHFALQYSLEAMQAGIDLTKGSHREIVGEVEVIFRPVARRWYEHVMCRADWYYAGGEVPALQLIYPDTEGRFQWQEGFMDYFRQPLLQTDAEQGTSEHDFWAANDPNSSLSRWKFSDPPHTRTFLSKTVQSKAEAVTFVAHNRCDATWEFLGENMIQDGDLPVVSCLHHVIDDDPTVEELHDLPLGWFATRRSPRDPWMRFEEAQEDGSSL